MNRNRVGAVMLGALLACASACDLGLFGASGLVGGGGGGGGGNCPAYQPSSPVVVVHGTVRLAEDSTPHPGTQPTIDVVLCGGNPFEVARGQSDSAGRFRMAFQVDCAQTYVLGIDWLVRDSTGVLHRETLVRISGMTRDYPPPNTLTLPADACAARDWQVDIWVHSAPTPA